MYRVWNILTSYSLLLIFGALTALIWANLDALAPVAGQPHYWAESYHHFVEFVIWDHAPIGHYHDGHRTLTLHYLVNDVLMALFFAIAAKEVWEAVILKNGSLRGRRAATPLFATAGGMFGPIAVYLGLAAILGSDTYDAVANGWAIPTATDIAFSYLVGRIVFGAGHPAVRFLLLLAIADDAAGLIILAIFYPSAELAPVWLLLSLGAAVGVFVLFNWLPRYLDRGNQARPNSTWVRQNLHFLPYLVAGCASWYGFMMSGLHPALGLLPIVPTIPHADRAFGIFADAEKYLHDLLNQIEHALKTPVEIVLFFFGLLNAGVEFSSMGDATWLVLAGLLIGKPVGIFLFGWLAAVPLGLGIPSGMRLIDLIVIGFVAAIGFTVSLFVASVAFEGGPVQDAAKMGALFSFGAALIAIVAGKLLKVEKQTL
ncbi:Na+/H+ antiporter NhaA [Aestuariivita sp.]|jgi:NhaA family Na+:H+ antiporter|uniref:Na+/H+ antiporter NhaA n=1 Tax=Aestuariivita sp. TaxID=1872407 RepID=UPI0021715BD6|nr:Na+/H+ antiporter NhaA [Aestuariivita sp.]MCE8006240.1 Na+/H+ antiporter NhaA [Aestuariivita sp.]